jgi:allophanate hydrolase
MSEPFTISRLRAAYRNGETSPGEIVWEIQQRIAAYHDPAVWISRVPDEEVMRRAHALMNDPSAKALPLYGIPFAVKDNIDCLGLPTTAACPEFAYQPQANATVVSRLLAAGAILLGKTNLDQFATGLVGTRSPYGAPRCVFNPGYISGGSSSGSAVAVAAGLATFALGTDTAGSGRVPAAFNNIVGLKPSRGLISTRGVVPACRSLDCVSIFSHNVEYAGLVAGVAEGFDADDPFARTDGQRCFRQGGFVFGILAAKDLEFFGDEEAAALYEKAIGRLTELGGQAIEIDYEPFRASAALLYQGPWVAERYAAIKNFIETRETAVERSVRKIIMGAKIFSAADAFEAQYKLAALRRRVDAEWEKIDVMLLPTVPTHYTVEQIASDPISLNARLGIYTNWVNLLDCCGIAVPAGFRSNGLPFGVSLLAPAFCDRAVSDLANRLQRRTAGGIETPRDMETAAPTILNGSEERISLFVVGAHLTGMPLNNELKERGARFLRSVRTSPDYRLFVLPNTTPAKPGLVHQPNGGGQGIAGEVWSLDARDFGRFVAKIPAPLGIGKIRLDDGAEVSGFLCEAYAIEGAEDISALGSWRHYMNQSS